MTAPSSPNLGAPGRVTPNAWLWVSAAVLVGLMVLTLARPARFGASGPYEAAAMAMYARDVTGRVGDFSMLSFDGGNEDIVLVLDGRAENLYAYRIKNQNTLEFLQREALADIFATGRQIGPGHDR